MTTIDGICLSDELKAELLGLQREEWYGKGLIENLEKSLNNAIMNPDDSNKEQNFEDVQVLWQCRKLVRMIIEAKEKDNE